MKRSALIPGVISAVLLLPITTMAAPHGGGGMGSSSMGSPSMGSSSTHSTTTTSTMKGPSQTGQPNQSCQASGSQTPGNAANSPGSPFNTSGQSGTVYAGQQPQNSKNTASVSQYDVACTRGGR